MGTITRSACIALLAAVPCVTSTAQTAPQLSAGLQPEDVKWSASPVPGVETAVLSGDLQQQGLYLLRVRLAKDSKLQPHTHPDVRYTTVLSGEMYFGFGEAFDTAKMKRFPAGAIIAIPANTPHYVWAPNGAVVVQDAGMGPTATSPLKK